MSREIELLDELATEELGAKLWQLISTYLDSSSSGLSIGLAGPLGAGKTTLVRAIGAGAGITGEVTSPTYVLQHEYRLPEFLIEHWDVYRLKSCPEDLLFAPEKKTVRLIEWCDKFVDLWAEQDGAIMFRISTSGSGELRSVALEGVLAAIA